MAIYCAIIAGQSSASGADRRFGFEVVTSKFRPVLVKVAMRATLTVEGMSCSHCEQTVEEAIEALTGVRNAAADREAEQVTVDGDASPEQLVAAVEDAGYDAST